MPDPIPAPRTAADSRASALRTVLRTALRRLPPGTIPVGGGVCALALASYVYLAIAGRTLSVDAMAGLSVLWSLAFSVGTGLFLPLEQELTRVVAARRARGEGVGPLALRGVRISMSLLLLCLAGLGLFAGPLARQLFRGDRSLVWALGAALAGLSVVHISRGLLAGSGHFRAYGAQLGIDSVLRVVLALALSLAGVTAPLPFALLLSLAPLISVAAGIATTARTAQPGPAAGPTELRKGLAPLTFSTLLGQVLPNAPVVLAELMTGASMKSAGSALTAALLSAMIIVRLPIFAAVSVQPSVLSVLSRAYALGNRAAFRRQLLGATAGALLLGAAGLLLSGVLGPWLATTLFHTPRALGNGDFAVLSLATAGLLLALILSQGQLAMNRQRAQGTAWALGAAVFLGLALLPGSVMARLEASYSGGCWTVALVLGLGIARHLRRHPAGPVAEASAAKVGTVTV